MRRAVIERLSLAGAAAFNAGQIIAVRIFHSAVRAYFYSRIDWGGVDECHFVPSLSPISERRKGQRARLYFTKFHAFTAAPLANACLLNAHTLATT